MKVLFISTDRIIEAPGGAQKVMCSFASELVNRGHEAGYVGLEVKRGGDRISR